MNLSIYLFLLTFDDRPVEGGFSKLPLQLKMPHSIEENDAQCSLLSSKVIKMIVNETTNSGAYST